MLVPHPILPKKKKKKKEEVNDICNSLCNPVNLFVGKLTEPRWPFINREIQNHNFGQQKRIDSA